MPGLWREEHIALAVIVLFQVRRFRWRLAFPRRQVLRLRVRLVRELSLASDLSDMSDFMLRDTLFVPKHGKRVLVGRQSLLHYYSDLLRQ